MAQPLAAAGRAAVRRRDHGHHRATAPPGTAAATPSSCSASRWRWTGAPGIWAVAGDTDGIDGMDDVAGALLAPDTLARVRAPRASTRARMLAGHDSHSLFDAARRPDPHRPDADQRQRFPRDPDRLRKAASP